MKEYNLLTNLLSTQEFSEKHATEVIEQVKDNTFDANSDPITAIIVNACEGKDYTEGDEVRADIEYAISQLRKALELI